MASLKEVRNRIVSVNSTKQITSAMKVVSAAKLRRAQDAVVRMRPYAEKLQEILSGLSTSLDTSEGVYTAPREVKNVLIVPITSNRGLCGGFNSYIIKETNRLIRETYSDKKVTVLSIGKKANDYYRKTDYNIKGSQMPRNLQDIYNQLDYEHVSEIAEKLMAAYRNQQFDRIIIIYNRFKNAAVQVLTTEQFLPVLPPDPEKVKTGAIDYIFEPGKQEMVATLVPKSLKTQLFKALLDSYAAEHGARMTAMHKATENATDLLKDLRLSYNKARQAAITKEILEIVGGAEALSK